MKEVFLDIIIDSTKIFLISFLIYFIFSFVADKVLNLLQRKKKIAPLIGSLSGIIPECSVPVVSADLFIKNKISLGTIIAIFLACSDEAFSVLLSSDKWYYIFLLVVIKVCIGFLVGFIIDLLYKPNIDDNSLHVVKCCDSFTHNHIIHPLLDAIKVFFYALVINTIFGLIIYYVGEDKISTFLTSNYYISPILAMLVGLIPNCASSILLTTLFVNSSIPFGALLAGLLVNAGLGILYLFKNKSKLKVNIIIILIMVMVSITVGYIFLFVK